MKERGWGVHEALRALAVVWALAALGALPSPALASNLGPGGGQRVIVGDQVVGAYRLWVTVAPDPAQVGQITIVVRVYDIRSGAQVNDPTIAVKLVNPADGTVLNTAATHRDAGNAIDFADHIDIPSAGTWDVAMHVSGPAGTSDVSFVEPVLAPRSASTLLYVGLPFLAALVFFGISWQRHAGGRSGHLKAAR
jgi:hypothetical protein